MIDKSSILLRKDNTRKELVELLVGTAVVGQLIVNMLASQQHASASQSQKLSELSLFSLYCAVHPSWYFVLGIIHPFIQ